MLFLTAVSASAQTIFIANSNAGAQGGTNVFTGANAINDALAAAATGDVIYVIPSGTVYNSVSVNKAVSIIGGGFNRDQAGGNASTVNNISVSSDNVRFSGLVTANLAFAAANSNIMIDKCRIRTIASSGFTLANVIIQNCILGEVPGIGNVAIAFTTFCSGVKIFNNIIYGTSTFSGAISGLNAALIENNVFLGTGPMCNVATNCSIRNNIFFGVSPSGATMSDNDQQNNLSYSAADNTFRTGNGNTSTNNIVNQNPMFVNFVNGSSFDFTFDLSLQPGSPAIGAGVGGTDMGIFGGLNPFDIYGTPLPIVKSISAPNTVPQGTNLNVRIQAKGN
jgi:hypothetical protein